MYELELLRKEISELKDLIQTLRLQVPQIQYIPYYTQPVWQYIPPIQPQYPYWGTHSGALCVSTNIGQSGGNL